MDIDLIIIISRTLKFNSTINSNSCFPISTNLFANINIINIDNGVFPPICTNISFVSFRPIWPWTLTFLWLCLIFYFNLIINISHSKSYPPHPYDLIFQQFKSLGFICLIRILTNNIPQFFLWVDIYTLQINLFLMIEPVPLHQPLLLFLLLIHKSTYLTCFLVFPI